ncbi:MAG TPA: hypothetical protein VNU93_08215, partial [Verrucomicrobiae bacterium]|nr:hypothetical protein [Verrucomicrobiae bacterium]
MEKTSGLVLEIGHNHCLVLTEDNNYVRIKLSGASPRVGDMFSGYPFESGFSLARRPVSRLWAYAASFLITLLVGGGGYVYAVTSPAAYVSLDANSSVELVVNSLGKVIKANSYNAQGNVLLGKVNVGSLPVKEAVRNLVTASAKESAGKDQTVVVTYTDSSFIEEAELDQVTLGALNEAHFTGDLLTQLVDRNYRSKAAEAHLSSGQLLVLDLLSGHVSLGREEFKNKNLNQVLAEHKIKLNQLINSEQTNQKFHPNLIPVQSGTPAQQNFTDTRPSKEGTQSTTGQPTSIQQTTLQPFDTGNTQNPAQ